LVVYKVSKFKVSKFLVVPISQWRYVLTAVVYGALLIHPTATTATAYRRVEDA